MQVYNLSSVSASLEEFKDVVFHEIKENPIVAIAIGIFSAAAAAVLCVWGYRKATCCSKSNEQEKKSIIQDALKDKPAETKNIVNKLAIGAIGVFILGGLLYGAYYSGLFTKLPDNPTKNEPLKEILGFSYVNGTEYFQTFSKS